MRHFQACAIKHIEGRAATDFGAGINYLRTDLAERSQDIVKM